MRPPVTIIAVLGPDTARARRLLSFLEDTISDGDEVLAVGGADAVVRPARRWLRAEPTPIGDGRAAVVAGLVHASHDVVVWITDEVEPTPHWLDPLVAVLGASSASVVVPATGASGSRRRLREEARDRWVDRRTETHPATAPDRRCVVTTVHALQLSGSVDVLLAEEEVIVAEGSLVGLEPPLVSACIIVRDEEETLAACLASIEGLVDEIVVYDTGSTDTTVDVARRCGATVVVEGEWHDDFGRARNDALAHCRGTWILHIDADEQLQCDPTTVRAWLAGAEDVDKLDIPIDNLDEDGRRISFTHYAARLFRRDRAWWTGRLHEQVVPRPDQPDLVARKSDAVRLVHSGYTAAAVEARDKHARNVRVAEAEVAAGDGNRALVLTNLGRALGAEGRHDEALDVFVEARDVAEDDVVLRLALRGGAEALLNAGRTTEALSWIDELRRVSDRPHMADYLEGVAHANLGDFDAAIERLAGIDEISDQDGMAYAPQLLDVRRGVVFAAAGRWAEAANALTAVVAVGDVSEAVWAPLAEACWRSGRPVDAAAALAEPDRLVSIAGQLLNAPAAAADAMAEALWRHQRKDARLVALAAAVAPRLDLERALVWSGRIRAAGAAGHCPVVAIADDRARPALERLRAAAVAAAAFGDERARTSLRATARSFPGGELRSALEELAVVAPEVLPEFVASAACSAPRAVLLAELLSDLGADDEAESLVEHAAVLAATA